LKFKVQLKKAQPHINDTVHELLKCICPLFQHTFLFGNIYVYYNMILTRM